MYWTIESQTWEDYSEGHWNSTYNGKNGDADVPLFVPKTYLTSMCFEEFKSDETRNPLSPSTTRTKMHMSASSTIATQIRSGNVNDVGEDVSTNGFYSSVILQNSNLSYNGQLLLSFVNSNLEYVPDPDNIFYDALTLHTDIVSCETNSVSAVVRSYLVDTNNLVCVEAEEKIELNPGTNSIELVFGGQHIYRQRSTGYKVGLVEVRSMEVYPNEVIATATNVASTVTLLSYSDFTPYKGVIVTKEAVGDLTESNLVFNVDVELNTQGAYTLVGELRDTNDVRVAHAIYTNLTYAGLQTIPLEFSREDIYLSGRPGPYKLTLLELRDADWELVDWIEKPVETDAFALAAMRPGCAALTVLSDSYSLNPLSFSADGFCDAVRLSLSVSNSLDSAIDCRVCVSVYSTNNEFVCRSYQAIEVSPGVNAYTLEVPGVEIAKSQIEGPYYIADILWEPMNGLPSERFVPEKELINVPRSSFGGSPFAVSGEAICRTGDVYKPIIVEVPIDVLRAGDISVSAIVTDTNGEFVVRSETNLVFSVGDDQKVAVEFSARDLISTGIAGPYVVSYLVLRSGYDGVEDVRIEEFKEVVDYTPILYVDAASGDDEADGLSVGTAKKTIQAALEWASDGVVINVGAGDYICPVEVDGETFLNVNKKVSIVATDDDPLKTRIVGQRGNSTNDVRGVYLVEGATLSGFTITNFLMSAGGGVGVYGEGLGAIVSNCVIAGCSATHDGGGVYQCTVYDSTILNCRAQNGGGAAQCNLIRCRIEGCTATRYGGGVAYGTADNCKIIRNTANYGGGGAAYATVLGSEISNNVQPTGNYGGGGAYQCSLSRCRIMENSSPSYYGGGVMQGTADNCVICGNSAQRGSGATAATLINCTVIGNRADVYGGGVYSGTLINSIVWGNTAPTSPNHYAGRGIYTCTTPLLDGDGNIDTDPVFRGAEFGGFMLSADSPCLDAGIDNGGVAEYIYSGTTSTVTAAVSTLDFFGNERTQGAHVDMGAVEGVTNAWLVMTRTEGSGLLDVSFELVEPHSSLTITADESLRPLDRFEINDGRVFFGPQMQLDDISCDTFVTAYFRCYDFYVDAKNGNDANDGLSWGAAKKTIQAAIDCAVDGEKIWVAKGVYVPISMLDRRVEIEAVDGSSLTFIDGGGTNRCATLATSGSLSSKTNSVLIGFTLMNGRSTQGGAAYGGTLRDCIIKSNKAEGSTYCYGGGTYYGMQVNCQYVGNAASATMYGYGGAAYYGTSYNCSYVDNSVYGPSNACGGAVCYGTHYDCAMTNNTSSSYGGASYYGTCYRTIVARNEAKWGGGCYGTSFYDGEIVRNTSSSHGGGVYYGSIYRSTIANNRSSGDGGGVYKASLTDCLVANNQALGGSGGGALLTDYTATRSSFVNNRARSNGGGVYGGTCTDCGITNNTATSNGGGAYNIIATRTSIVGNNAVTGGGIYNGTYNSCILETNTSSGEGGGAYSGTFYDSLISNNQASGVGGGLRGCTFHRSRIIGNRSHADGGGVYNGTGYNSLIVQNKGLGNGGGVYGGYNYNCTITENWCGGSGGGISSGYHYNTIIWGNTNPDGSNNTSGGSFYSCRTASPSFVNPGEGDYRLRSGSPCINAGNNSYANGASDLALAARIQGGTVDMGAYEGGVAGLIVTIDSLGVGDLEYGSTIITNGGTFTVSAQSTGRAFLHFLTNGVIATTAPTLTLDGISSDVKITAEFVHEMFVDGAKGADGNSGLSWENAKKTIQAAIDESIEGDTIWVADGVYAPIRSMKQIAIVSVNGSGVTIIDGDGQAGCAILDSTWLKDNSTGTRLSGFTIRNGRQGNGAGVQFGMVDNCIIENCHATGHGGGADYSMISNCVIRNNTAQDYGGGIAATGRHRIINCQIVANRASNNGGGQSGDGVFRNCLFDNNIAGANGGALYGGTAFDCAFSNNRAAAGGATYNGTFYRCVLSGNTSTGDGGGAYYGTFYDSVVTNNTGSGAGGGLYRSTYWRSRIVGNVALGEGGGVYNGTGYNSLIVGNRTTASGSGGGTSSGYTYNCTVFGNETGNYGGGTYNGYHYNSIIWGNNSNGDEGHNTYGGSYYSCRIANPRFVDAGGGDFRLRVGSACINAGNASYVNGSTDIIGRTRVQDGTVDIGAYEGAVSGHVVTVRAVGSGSLEHDAIVVVDGGSFEVTSRPTVRAFLHFMTNDVIATTAPTLTLGSISDDIKVTAVFVHEMFVDGTSGDDGNDGLSWATAKQTIQAAIDESVEGDTIWVADGIYKPINTQNRRVEIVGVNGSSNAVIDGGNTTRCVTLGSGATHDYSVIRGFTVRNGFSSGNGGGIAYGRAVDCVIENCTAAGNSGGAETVSLSNCVVRWNSADGSGGGSGIYGSCRRVSNCKFVGNTARNYGGGVYGGAVENCELSGNIAGGSGGGMYSGYAFDSVFSGNRAVSGGGRCEGVSTRCQIFENTSTGDGGGAYNGTLYDSVISNNTASGVGGGLYRSTFHRSHVVDNKASGDGGGVYNGTGYNSIVAKNRTNVNGGGTYSGNNYNCTITENYSAGSGGGTYSGYQYNTIIWNNRNAYGEVNCEGGGSQYNCRTANPKFVNAAEGDYRLRVGSLCLNAGNASYVNGSLDVARRTRVVDGTVDIGAHEGATDGFVVAVQTKGGAIVSHSTSVVGNDGSFTIYSVEGSRPFKGVFTNGVLLSSSLPFTCSGIMSDVEIDVSFVNDLYVDANRGDDANSGFSQDAAKKNIQAAIDVSIEGDVIHVADGWYSPFSSGNRAIHIVGDNGPDNCFVDGEFESRCATLGNSASEVKTIIKGLTLCNGYSSAGGGCYYGTAINCVIEDCYSTGSGGGSYGTLLRGCTLVGNVANSNGGASCGDRVVAWNCIFMDNVSCGNGGGTYNGAYYDSTFDGNRAYSNGGAAYGSTLQRCILYGNQAASGGGTYNGWMGSCLYYDNYATSSAGGAYYGTLYNCTLTRNKSSSQPAGMYYPTAYNTICWGNKLNSGATSDSYGSSFYNCCLSGSAGSNPLVANPLFFDPDHDDFRLSMNSPCLDRGTNSNVADATDLLGRTRTQNGTVDIGCYEGPVNIWQINAIACGVGSIVSNGCSVTDGGSLSFIAIEDGYPFLGFYTNGVFATSETEFTWENISSHGTLEAWFKQDYYVDASMPDDSRDGLTWETARKDLSAVVAETSNGANIWVKGGTYAPIVSQNKHLVITAVDGNGNTIISGDGIGQCANLTGASGSISTQTNTVLIGFTLRDGVAINGAGAYGGTLRNCVIESNRATNYGGGTYYGVQQDCIYRCNIVSNGASYARGGAAYYGTSYNCTYTGNLAMGATNTYGGAIYGGVHYDCTISSNKSSRYGGGFYVGTYHRSRVVGNDAYFGGGCGNATIYDSLICNNSARTGGGGYNGRFYGCTIVDNVATNCGGAYLGAATNSIIYGNNVVSGTYTNWYSVAMQYSCAEPLANGRGNICADPLFVDTVNGNYRLTEGSPCLDAGYNVYVNSMRKDIDSKYRIINGVVDMGCYEGMFFLIQETRTTPVPVEHVWLESYHEILEAAGDDYEAMANAQSPGTNGGGKVWPDGSAYYMWQDFVAGTNPTNENSVFTSKIEIVDGKPVIKWEPDTPELRATRIYKTLGKKTLMDKDWVDITNKDQSEYHFFRVTVDLP